MFDDDDMMTTVEDEWRAAQLRAREEYDREQEEKSQEFLEMLDRVRQEEQEREEYEYGLYKQQQEEYAAEMEMLRQAAEEEAEAELKAKESEIRELEASRKHMLDSVFYTSDYSNGRTQYIVYVLNTKILSVTFSQRYGRVISLIAKYLGNDNTIEMFKAALDFVKVNFAADPNTRDEEESNVGIFEKQPTSN